MNVMTCLQRHCISPSREMSQDTSTYSPKPLLLGRYQSHTCNICRFNSGFAMADKSFRMSPQAWDMVVESENCRRCVTRKDKKHIHYRRTLTYSSFRSSPPSKSGKKHGQANYRYERKQRDKKLYMLESYPPEQDSLGPI